MAAAAELKTSSQTSLFGSEELNAKVKLQDKPDWPALERLQLEAEAIGFYLSAHPLDVYKESMERLGVTTYADAIKGIKTGDTIYANLAGCLQSFQRKISKSGKPFAFVKLSDTTSAYEGLLFSDGITKFEHAINSGLPLYAKVKIEKQADDMPPRMLFNVIKTLDEEITENSKGLIIVVNNVEAVRPIREALSHERYGTNKVYIKPENDDWDIRIELKNGYALANGDLLSSIRAIAGVTLVKEI